MPYTPPIKSMTPTQQQHMLAIAELGLSWVQGKTAFAEVQRTLGPPQHKTTSYRLSYSYYWESFGVDFVFNEDVSEKGSPVPKQFIVITDSYFEPHIRMSDYEARLGLQRLVRGEKIDGLRVMERDFFNPGRCVNCDPNRVILGYRLPLPSDSLYDIYVDFDYLGKDDAPHHTSLRDPENLRAIHFNRRYLTPEQLDDRRAARHHQYGMMDLRTGMLCPETAIWEGWTENGPTDATVVYAGRLFPTARNVPYQNPVPYEWVNARWMWLRESPRDPLSES
jgi:hypothetical protein